MKMITPIRSAITGLSLLLLLGLSSANAAEPAAPKEHPVFCWYMVCFGNSVEVYKQEIELAQRHGIDGFVLDVGAWDGNYIKSTDKMFEAAKELGTGFKLMMGPEYSVQPFATKVSEMVLKYRDHPNQFKHDGKVVLSGYGAASMFPPAVEKLKAAGVEVCLVPALFLPRFLFNPSFDAYVNEFTTTPVLDGLMMFTAEEWGTVIGDNASARRATQKLGKILAACVIPAYNSANLGDYHGLSGYLSMWQGAIDDSADWISIVIWNDYNEDSGLMPGRWPFGSERYQFDRDESFLEATAYGSAWFKTGQRPAITQDKIFLTYRNRSKWLRQAWTGKKWIDLSLQPGIPYDQIHDDVEDRVYVDSFLTAPATATVQLAGKTQRFELPAGVGHAELPMAPGVPQLTLTRNNQVLADVVGRRAIIDKPTEHNSYLGYHHLNRTWTSGTVIGPVLKRLEAESGTLGTGAVVVTVGKIKAVQNAEIKDSGFTVPVDGLTTGTYNIRIIYSNPSDEDARLTLFADGPPRAKSDYPYFIPAWMPPTGKGQFRTVSFLWSLYDTTHTLKMLWLPGKMWGQPDPHDDDYGTPLIDAIELVKVEPFPMPAVRDTQVPELVAIPGGSFVMGSTKGEPDEVPTHKVTISPFAIGKFEITNEEFEKFDPTHHAFRDGNSWRDHSPVLHISWVDAAKYCNWLSQQNALTPVYAEKDGNWVADLTANGFRLPTEAEWEYVATGRGEGRTYPWGNAAPVSGVQGRFQLQAGLGARLPRSATEDNGVVVVGSFPAGASRDGVMDLAGNAAEWCTDWYGYYSAEAQENPCQQTPGNYRVIRGGSWGWYNYSQRCTARDFNSQNYPGHAYYGLRVAVSATGWEKLKQK